MNRKLLHAAITARNSGDSATAESLAREALRAPEDQARLCYELGLCRHMARQVEAAANLYQQALRLDDKPARWHFNFGAALAELGRLNDAEEAFHASARRAPDWPDPVAALAALLEQAGRLDEAAALLNTVTPSAISVNLALIQARIHRRIGNPDTAEEVLRPFIKKADVTFREREALLFEWARILDENGQFPDAFRALDTANHVGKHPYDSALADRQLKDLTATAARWKALSAQPKINQHPKALLIVGLPRSGTTLLHEMLCMHPQIHGRGESPILDSLARSLCTPHLPTIRALISSLAEADTDALSKLTAAYFYGAPATVNQWVVDKMPENFWYLGLAAAVLPGLRVIHMQRDLRDTGLSCYFQPFAQGHEYAFDLSAFGHYAATQRQVMEQWKAQLGGQICTCHYEELVTNPQQVLTQLLENLELSWDSACLDFHAKEQASSYTASYAQIRQPLHTQRIARWKRYSEQLAPLFAALEAHTSPCTAADLSIS